MPLLDRFILSLLPEILFQTTSAHPAQLLLVFWLTLSIAHHLSIEQLVDEALTGQEASQIYICTHPPVRRTPDGRPLLALTAVDHALAQRLVKEGRISQAASVGRFRAVFLGSQRSSEVSGATRVRASGAIRLHNARRFHVHVYACVGVIQTLAACFI